MMSNNLSSCAETLTGSAKARYKEKILICQLKTDPYSDEKNFDAEPDVIPNVQWNDLYMYMISTPSQHTKEEIRAWKSMTGSDSFVKAGWVQGMKLLTYQAEDGESRFLVRGIVKHSQRMTAIPLLPWFAAEKSGEILAAHCTCMAGLGEACSHIAALISSVMHANQLRKVPGSDACTSSKCVWLPPSRNVSAAPVQDISFNKPSSNGSVLIAASYPSAQQKRGVKPLS